ncbi:MAG: hypothetical protein P9M03_13340, partial [Candidatus Theseobacter exili]|nr:hypothetical protein [Candidatus Theseobacter exili]
AKIASGMADKIIAILGQYLVFIIYAKRKLNMMKAVMERSPEQASATSSWVCAKYNMFPSRKTGIDKIWRDASDIFVANN